MFAVPQVRRSTAFIKCEFDRARSHEQVWVALPGQFQRVAVSAATCRRFAVSPSTPRSPIITSAFIAKRMIRSLRPYRALKKFLEEGDRSEEDSQPADTRS